MWTLRSAVGLPSEEARAELVQQLAATLRTRHRGVAQVNSLGFAGVADLANELGYPEGVVALIGRLASHNQRPLFDVLEHGSTHWVRLAGGVPLALVNVAELREDGRWVRDG